MVTLTSYLKSRSSCLALAAARTLSDLLHDNNAGPLFSSSALVLCTQMAIDRHEEREGPLWRQLLITAADLATASKGQDLRTHASALMHTAAELLGYLARGLDQFTPSQWHRAACVLLSLLGPLKSAVEPAVLLPGQSQLVQVCRTLVQQARQAPGPGPQLLSYEDAVCTCLCKLPDLPAAVTLLRELAAAYLERFLARPELDPGWTDLEHRDWLEQVDCAATLLSSLGTELPAPLVRASFERLVAYGSEQPPVKHRPPVSSFCHFY